MLSPKHFAQLLLKIANISLKLSLIQTKFAINGLCGAIIDKKRRGKNLIILQAGYGDMDNIPGAHLAAKHLKW